MIILIKIIEILFFNNSFVVYNSSGQLLNHLSTVEELVMR